MPLLINSHHQNQYLRFNSQLSNIKKVTFFFRLMRIILTLIKMLLSLHCIAKCINATSNSCTFNLQTQHKYTLRFCNIIILNWESYIQFSYWNILIKRIRVCCEGLKRGLASYSSRMCVVYSVQIQQKKQF